LDDINYIEFLLKRHFSTVAKSGKYLWLASDSEKNFNLHKEQLSFYIDNPIEYNINKQFFRSEFDFDVNRNLEVDLYLGCSHTFGFGHLWKHSWPYLVSQHTNNTIINLGVNGAGTEMAYINLKKYIDRFDVKNVFHYQPIYPRFYYFKGGHYSIHADKPAKSWNSYGPYGEETVKYYFTKEEIILHNHTKHIDGCRGICSQRGINYYHIHDEPQYEKIGIKIPARDRKHRSNRYLKALARDFIKMMEGE